jgi:hypothetical protein
MVSWGTCPSRVLRQCWLAGGHDSLPAGVTVSGPRRFFLVLAWMITAHESRSVASYREQQYGAWPRLRGRSRTRSRRFRCPYPTPDLKGTVTCTTRHLSCAASWPPRNTPWPDTPCLRYWHRANPPATSATPWAGAQRLSSDTLRVEVPKLTTRESPGPEMP